MREFDRDVLDQWLVHSRWIVQPHNHVVLHSVLCFADGSVYLATPINTVYVLLALLQEQGLQQVSKAISLNWSKTVIQQMQLHICASAVKDSTHVVLG